MYGFFFAPVQRPKPKSTPKPTARKAAGPQRHRQHSQHHQEQSAPPVRNLHLGSTGTTIAAGFLGASPSVVALAVEDVCLQAATVDWKRRRPRWWSPRARAVWRAEKAQLAADADRLRELAGEVLQEL